MTTYAALLSRLPVSGSAQSVLRAGTFIAIALCALVAHFLLGAVFGIFGFVWIALAMAIAFLLSPELAVALLMVCLFLQNAFVSAMMPLILVPTNYSILLGSSFAVMVLAAVFSLPLWLKMQASLPAESRMLLRWLFLFGAVVVGYTILGAAMGSTVGTLIYVRVYFTGMIMLIIGVAIGFQLPFDYIINVTRVLALFLITWAGAEYFFTHDLYETFNAVSFLNFKSSSLSSTFSFASTDELINYETNSYLNLSGSLGLDIDLLRLLGPNFHAISFAYGLAFCSLVCFMGGRYIITGLCTVLIVLVGAKGPLLLNFLALGLSFFYGRTRNPRWLLIGLTTALGIFIPTGIIYGIYTEDYHVIGFLGGLHGFFDNPLGHGIGVGGNLSALGQNEADFNLFQGYGADFALESAFGVMLYQIGLGTIVCAIFCKHIWKNVWKAVQYFHNEPRLIVMPVAIAFLFADSIFQEEVLSPNGWGLWFLLSGMLLAKYWKQNSLSSADI